MQCLDNFDEGQRYRHEYDNNYSNFPGPSEPPSHRANLGSYNSSLPSRMYSSYDQKEDDCHRGQSEDNLSTQLSSDTPELSRFNEADRYSLRDASNFVPPPMPEVS